MSTNPPDGVAPSTEVGGSRPEELDSASGVNPEQLAESTTSVLADAAASETSSTSKRQPNPPLRDPNREKVPITKELCLWLKENFPSIHAPHKTLPKWFKHSCFVTLSDCHRLIQHEETPEQFKEILQKLSSKLDKEKL